MVRLLKEDYFDYRFENPDKLVDRIEKIAIEEYGNRYDIEVVETKNNYWEILADGEPQGYFTLESLDYAVDKAKESARSTPTSLFGRKLSSTDIAKISDQNYKNELESQLYKIVDVILKYIPPRD